MATREVQIESGWKNVLLPAFEKPYMNQLRQFLQEERNRKQVIYPLASEFFAAFNETPFDNVKVVIIGQDPYHGPGQAHGLCFSVLPGTPLPPSLKNIYKELESDLGIPPAQTGYLMPWARQGVLLLNATLSVRAGQAGSHQNKGWEEFTDAVIDQINQKKEHVAFLLWGSYAQKKGKNIDRSKHYVIQAPHPSPLSAHRGFFGSKPFSKINHYLREKGLQEIDWSLA